MKLLRVYVDTSVIGGCLDEEFATDSLRLFKAIKNRKVTLLLSDIVVRELTLAPRDVLQVLEDLSGLDVSVEKVPLTEEVLALRDAYVQAGVVGRRWLDDAGHVAAATIARADAIVSWNFKHIVRLDKMKAYNQVNLANGYGILTIISPSEVRIDDNNEE